MTIETVPLPLPATANPTKFADFSREVRGVNPGVLSRQQFREIEELLYKVQVSVPIRYYPSQWSIAFDPLVPGCGREPRAAIWTGQGIKPLLTRNANFTHVGPIGI